MLRVNRQLAVDLTEKQAKNRVVFRNATEVAAELGHVAQQLPSCYLVQG